jgi:hypothetical protein
MFTIAVPVEIEIFPSDTMDIWSRWEISGSVFFNAFISGALAGILLGG